LSAVKWKIHRKTCAEITENAQWAVAKSIQQIGPRLGVFGQLQSKKDRHQ
jgi:hypothetical protein